jgi:transposase
LKRAFLGWLRGERHHCKMAAIPTSAEEDARRPHRERETLIGEQTTIINRIKATLARLGIRSLNPKLKKAPERLEHLRTPEGEPIPPNTLAELRRDMARKQLVAEQIQQIEKARLEQLKQAPKAGLNLMVLDHLHSYAASQNIRLYRRCGFTEIGKRPHPSRPCEVLVDMEKRAFGSAV